MIDPTGLLMIEPSTNGDVDPVIDALTRQMAAALRSARQGPPWKGFHRCTCGASSGSCDLYVQHATGELRTNSLAVHYLAYHRAEVPQAELEKVKQLPRKRAEPTERELSPSVKAGHRAP